MRSLLIPLLALAASGLIRAQNPEALDADTRILISHELPFARGFVNDGYGPLRLRLESEEEAPQDLIIEASCWTQSRRRGGLIITRELRIDPGEVITFEMPIHAGNNTLEIRGRDTSSVLWEANVTAIGNYGSRRFSPLREPILSILQLGEVGELSDLLPSRGLRRGTQTQLPSLSGVRLSPFFCTAEEMPVHSACLLGIDLIIATESALRALRPDQREALVQTLESGGRLITFDAHSDELERLLPGIRPGGAPRPWRLGFGRILPLLDPLESTRDLAVALQRVADGPSESLFATRRLGLRIDVPLDERRRIPGLDDIPINTFAIFMVLFAVVVGPLNFLVLHRMKRRPLAIVTIPLISLVAFLAMVGYAILGEGLSVKLTPRSITFLDQSTQRATVWSQPGYYASLPPSGGLVLDETVAAFGPNFHRRRFGDYRSEISQGQHLRGGWIPARTANELVLVQPGTACRQELRRELEAQGAPRVTNLLGVEIEAVAFHGNNGLHVVHDLSPGTSASGVPLMGRRLEDLLLRNDEERALWSSLRSQELARLGALAPDEFLAITKSALTPLHGLESPRENPGFHIVRGCFARRKR